MPHRNGRRVAAIVRWVVRTCAALVVIGILAAFFFPVTTGPYTAVNGPATAFKSLRYSALLRLALVLASVSLQAGNVFFGPLAQRIKTVTGTTPTINRTDLDQFCVRLC